MNEILFLNYRTFTVASHILYTESDIRYPGLEKKNPVLPDDATIASSRAAALDYSAKLPDFACVQQTIRQISRGRKFNWSVQDWIHAELIYTGGREHYRNVTGSGRPASIDELHRTGSWSKGEFGSTLKDLFSPETAARFTLVGESRAGARPAREYKFEVDASTSNWLVLYGDPVFPPYHGRVWIDPACGLVLKIEKASTGLPAHHPVERIGAKVEYGWMKIDGKSYLLPVRAETLSCFRNSFECRQNDIEFRNYRKFEVESKLIPD